MEMYRKRQRRLDNRWLRMVISDANESDTGRSTPARPSASQRAQRQVCGLYFRVTARELATGAALRRPLSDDGEEACWTAGSGCGVHFPTPASEHEHAGRGAASPFCGDGKRARYEQMCHPPQFRR